MKKQFGVLVVLALWLTFYSCKDDDDSYMPLVIQTQGDNVQLLSNETVAIPIFDNDVNVPIDGIYTYTQPNFGTVTLENSGTTETILDDVLRYTPSPDVLGETTFTYTICNDLGDGCETETVTVVVNSFSPVNLNLEDFPLPKLSDYQFFQGSLSDLDISAGLIQVQPISQLFTDYAIKARYIYVPQGQSATYIDDYEALDFPIGSALIKVFYYDNVLPSNTRRIIETRLMVKKSDGWDFAEYVWNDAQTDADLEATGDGGFTEVNWIQNGEERFVNYRIPARTQCFICHTNSDVAVPLGITPKSLNVTFAYPEGSQNQLDKLIEVGYLEETIPSSIDTVVDWKDTTESLEDRVRSYVDINCANCHKDGGQGDYRAIRLSYEDTEDNLINLGVCIDADTQIPGFMGDKLIEPGDSDASILRYRMNIVESQYTMPQFGRNLPHEEALDVLDEWINLLTETCD